MSLLLQSTRSTLEGFMGSSVLPIIGAVVGGIAGSIIPGVGTAIGAGLGGALGEAVSGGVAQSGVAKSQESLAGQQQYESATIFGEQQNYATKLNNLITNPSSVT